MTTENIEYSGNPRLTNIAQHHHTDAPSPFLTIDKEIIQSIYKTRDPFSQKYDFGHALLYAGSKNMMGAAILCAKATLRSGAGLVTVYTETSDQLVIQIAFPEAMTSTENDFSKIINKKNSIGIGPGIEESINNKNFLKKVIAEWNGPLVIDATALSLLPEYHNNFFVKRQKNPAILTTARR
ncbi:MAG: ADP/ATP-dependent (S)-NAD(P)H-hydrate dehydratase [Ferruginibacter sp.]